MNNVYQGCNGIEHRMASSFPATRCSAVMALLLRASPPPNPQTNDGELPRLHVHSDRALDAADRTTCMIASSVLTIPIAIKFHPAPSFDPPSQFGLF